MHKVLRGTTALVVSKDNEAIDSLCDHLEKSRKKGYDLHFLVLGKPHNLKKKRVVKLLKWLLPPYANWRKPLRNKLNFFNCERDISALLRPSVNGGPEIGQEGY
eukprot:SAG25_NODE_11123_length_313_cov_0.714953_1_plen_103_part_11